MQTEDIKLTYAEEVYLGRMDNLIDQLETFLTRALRESAHLEQEVSKTLLGISDTISDLKHHRAEYTRRLYARV